LAHPSIEHGKKIPVRRGLNSIGLVLVWVGTMAATEASADKNAVFRKLRTKSDNKVLLIQLIALSIALCECRLCDFFFSVRESF
jgi:hypothetical protein